VEAQSGIIPEIATPGEMAVQIEALRKAPQSGARTLLTAPSDVFSLASEAAALCRNIAERGLSVIMIDWSLNGSGIAEPLGQPAWPGFNELVEGRARFEDVVRSLRDSDVHLIPCGHAVKDLNAPLDGDSINFLLDALDDVYEHIVVVARTEPARRLFEAIQGRFDCGVTLVADKAQKAKIQAEGAGSFLGFEVDGIALFTLDPSEARPRARQKIARTG
jgi:hypothetical protein